METPTRPTASASASANANSAGSTPVASRTDQERINYLNSKNIFSGSPNKDEIFNFLCHPEEAGDEREHYKKCQARLDRLICPEAVPRKAMTFDKFCEMNDAWAAERSFVFHRDHPAVRNKDWTLKQRSQLSGLCYMHGPVLLQHYLLCMTSETEVGMINLSKWINDHFSQADLERLILEEVGGHSHTILESIMEDQSNIVPSGYDTVVDNLLKFGPGLVSNFKVFSQFFANKTQHIHHGEPQGELVGRHCMLLIGVRQDGDGKIFFLLQNWWKQKQFVEVDVEYIKRCNANLVFVETRQTQLIVFPVEFTFMMETNLDNCDGYYTGEY